MNTALSTSHNDAAFYRDRKAMLVFPLIIYPFVIVLYVILSGGKGERYIDAQMMANKAGATGFNASVPTAKNSAISNRSVDRPGYGKAAVGQLLSDFTHTKPDSSSSRLKAIPASNITAAPTGVSPASSLAGGTTTNPVATQSTHRNTNRAAAIAATGRPTQRKSSNAYYYNPPKPYYNGAATDQQLTAQLRDYQNSRTTGGTPATPIQPRSESIVAQPEADGTQPALVQLSDNLTASRLNDAVDANNAFNTAPTSGSRRVPERAVLSGSNSYGSKKTIAWMIPVVIHDDQAVKSGNSVKLRLLKEVSADGITIPANTILYAVCQLDNERLRMTVRNVQLGGQLIPLDLEVYDLDGSPGVNMPGISNQVSGQLQSSAIQGVQLPGVGGLVNSVANSARMHASQAARQTTLRLRGGYNLYLKAQ